MDIASKGCSCSVPHTIQVNFLQLALANFAYWPVLLWGLHRGNTSWVGITGQALIIWMVNEKFTSIKMFSGPGEYFMKELPLLRRLKLSGGQWWGRAAFHVVAVLIVVPSAMLLIHFTVVFVVALALVLCRSAEEQFRERGGITSPLRTITAMCRFSMVSYLPSICYMVHCGGFRARPMIVNAAGLLATDLFIRNQDDDKIPERYIGIYDSAEIVSHFFIAALTTFSMSLILRNLTRFLVANIAGVGLIVCFYPKLVERLKEKVF